MLLAELRSPLDAGLDDITRATVVRALVRRIDIHTVGDRGPLAARAVVECAFADEGAFATGSC